jgi:GNAT superfamily N-acetyltransferase
MPSPEVPPKVAIEIAPATLAGDERVVGEFGMLVADPARRGEGIGRELVRFAEALSRRRGLATMQLELLVPRSWSHPNKEFLHAWYTRIGYRPVRTGPIEESYPQLAPLVATPCDFVIYHKPLTVGTSE